MHLPARGAHPRESKGSKLINQWQKIITVLILGVFISLFSLNSLFVMNSRKLKCPKLILKQEENCDKFNRTKDAGQKDMFFLWEPRVFLILEANHLEYTVGSFLLFIQERQTVQAIAVFGIPTSTMH